MKLQTDRNGVIRASASRQAVVSRNRPPRGNMSISSRLISLFLVLLMTMPPFAYSRQDVRVSPSAGATQTQPPAFTGRYPRYRVRAGDVLDLNFPFTPEFNQTVTIQPDGYTSL